MYERRGPQNSRHRNRGHFRRAHSQVMVMPELATQQPQQSSNAQILANLAASGDNWVKLLTIVLITVSGSTNFFNTQQTARATKEEVAQVIRQINDIHTDQKQYLEEIAKVQETNQLAHENQVTIAQIKANQNWL